MQKVDWVQMALKAAIIIVVFAVVCCCVYGTFFLYAKILEANCLEHGRMMDVRAEYTPRAGCFIEIDGQMVPLNSVTFYEERGQ